MGRHLFHIGELFPGTDGSVQSIEFVARAALVAGHSIVGTAGADRLLGTTYRDLIDGLAGDDTLIGGGGDDTLIGGIGDDSLVGGPGLDTASYVDGAVSGITLSLALASAQPTGGAGTDLLLGIEHATGSAFADRLSGSSWQNRLIGLDGNDSIAAGSRNDVLDGGSGDDSLIGGPGGDHIDGGAGNDFIAGGSSSDTIDYTTATAGIALSLALTGAQATGGSGSDTVVGIESILGSSFADRLEGNAAPNFLNGGAGDDTLSTGAGNDGLTGGPGRDWILFDTPLDPLTNVDAIGDFDVVDDRIVLDRGVFAALPAGALAASSFHSGAGVTSAQDADDRLIYDTTLGFLAYDADGSAGAFAAVRFLRLLGGPDALDESAFFIIG